jgi:2-polyprenyl-6-methoxyphenol hydroxylase-like FAD-dependent oxidoreductase
MARPRDGADHAVVIGAGMAGLSIAKALTAGFERVTVLDRDPLPDDAVHRPSVPQDRHLHLLLPSGVEALGQLFPGLLDQLVNDGAASGDADRIRVCLNGHRLAPARTGHLGVFATRPFVEAHVRERVRQDDTITVRDDARITGLVVSPDRARVDGVRLEGAQDGSEALAAELVVDCSGRRSPMPSWLEELGFDPPETDELRVDVRYATRRYRLAPHALDGDRHVLVGPTPDTPRGGAMTNVEDGSWLVTLFAMAGERVPTGAEDLERFAADLPIGDIYTAIRDGQALDQTTSYRFRANRRYRYERMETLPDGLLVAGDAVCSFNPIYGQGISVAAIEARALQERLESGGVPTARDWFASVIAPIVDPAWDLAIGADLAVPAVDGKRDLVTRATSRYLARLHAAAAHDPRLTERFIRVAGLLDPPTSLLRPSTVAHVLRQGLRPRPPRP